MFYLYRWKRLRPLTHVHTDPSSGNIWTDQQSRSCHQALGSVPKEREWLPYSTLFPAEWWTLARSYPVSYLPLCSFQWPFYTLLSGTTRLHWPLKSKKTLLAFAAHRLLLCLTFYFATNKFPVVQTSHRVQVTCGIHRNHSNKLRAQQRYLAATPGIHLVVNFKVHTWDLMWVSIKNVIYVKWLLLLDQNKGNNFGETKIWPTLLKRLVGGKKGWFHQNNEKDEEAFLRSQDKPAYNQEYNNTRYPLSYQVSLTKWNFLPPNFFAVLSKTNRFGSHSHLQASILLHVLFTKLAPWIYPTILICTWFRVSHGRKVSSSYTGGQ